MTTQEKINAKKEQISKKQLRITKDNEAVKKLQSDITILENFEVKTMINDLGLPLTKVKSLLQELQKQDRKSGETE